MKQKSKKLWMADLTYALITVASFTAALIPAGRVGPKLFNIPYTVWMGVVFCLLFIVLAYIASKLQGDGPDDH
jgi:uncharacterized membrane protein (DUF4010 family)